MHCVVVLQQMLRRYTHAQLYYRQGCRRRRREEDVCSVLFYLQLLLLHLVRRSTPATSPRSALCGEVLHPPPGPCRQDLVKKRKSRCGRKRRARGCEGRGWAPWHAACSLSTTTTERREGQKECFLPMMKVARNVVRQPGENNTKKRRQKRPEVPGLEGIVSRTTCSRREMRSVPSFSTDHCS